jgi:hypothetical protein
VPPARRDSAWQPLASGTNSGASLRLGSFDPTLLLNGLYCIQVVGYYSNGTTQFDFHDVVVKGGMKIGHFTMSFDDLTLPVAGIPVTVTRTYDSRDTRKGDFGIGWSLSVSDVRLQKNGPVGGYEDAFLWQQRKAGFNYTVAPRKPRIVTVPLPGGQVYSFRAGLSPSGQSFYPVQAANVVWSAQPGTKARLRAVGDTYVSIYGDGYVGAVALWNDSGDDEFGDGCGAGGIYDPKEWELTLPDGRVLHLNENGDTASGDKAKLEYRQI